MGWLAVELFALMFFYIIYDNYSSREGIKPAKVDSDGNKIAYYGKASKSIVFVVGLIVLVLLVFYGYGTAEYIINKKITPELVSIMVLTLVPFFLVLVYLISRYFMTVTISQESLLIKKPFSKDAKILYSDIKSVEHLERSRLFRINTDSKVYKIYEHMSGHNDLISEIRFRRKDIKLIVTGTKRKANIKAKPKKRNKGR